MKQFAYLIPTAFLLLGLSSVSATLVTGDIGFVGFNVDGGDDFAIVAITNITNETLYFTDNEAKRHWP